MADDTIPGRIATQAEETRNFIAGKWDFADDKANTAFDDAVEAITAIKNLGFPIISSPTVTFDDIDADFTIEVAKPTLPTVEFDWPDTKPSMGELLPYPTLDFPTSEFNSLSLETIQAVRTKLAAGGTGIGATAEEALWARMRARNDAKNLAAYEEAEGYFAARGWDLPPGALSARLLQIQSEILRSETDLNNDITVEQARLIAANDNVVLELALKTVIEYEKGTIERIATQNKNTVDVFISSMEGYKIDIQAESARVESLSKIVISLLEGYKTEVEAAGILVEAQAKEVDAKVKIQLAEADVALKTAEIEMEIAKFLWASEMEAQKAIATVAAQLAASAMSAVNASVSSQYGASSNEGAQYNVDATKGTMTTSTSYNHNFDETS